MKDTDFDRAVKLINMERSLEGMWTSFSRLLDCQVTQLSRCGSWNLTTNEQVFKLQYKLIAS
jgi:hypothetical protein